MKFFFSIQTYCILVSCYLLSCTSVNGDDNSLSDTLIYSYKKASYIQRGKVSDSAMLTQASVIYPEFTKGKKATIDSINIYIRYAVYGGQESAEKFVKRFVDESLEIAKENNGLAFQGWSSRDSISVISNTPTIVAIKNDHYSFTGGAHGNPSILYKNFDAKTGKLIRLDEILDSDMLKSFAKINLKWMKKSKGIDSDLTLEDAGYFVEGDNLPMPSSFALTSNGLLVSYNYYEIANYAERVIEYTIPYDELKGVIKGKYIQNSKSSK